MTDWDLIQQYIENRSESAFRQLVDRHLAFVYQVCWREIGDRQTAHDAALAVFLLLSHKAPTIRQGVQLKSWLFSAARLTSRNAVQQERRRRAREQQACEMAQIDTNAAHSSEAAKLVDTHLNDALSSLSKRERDAVLLRYEQDLEVAEVGKSLGISESAAQMRLSRGLEKMRRFFGVKGASVGIAAIAAAFIAAKAEAVPDTLYSQAASVGSTGLAGGISAEAVLLYKGAMKAMWIAKMKMLSVAAAATVIVVCVGLGAAHMVGARSTPNAFDYYVQAGKMVQGDVDFTTAGASDNAAVVAQNEPALKVMREGFAYKYASPAITLDSTMPYLPAFRKLARILSAEGQVRAASGDWAGAADSGLDAVRLGTDTPHGSVLIGMLVGDAVDAVGRREVWTTVDHLTSAQALAAEKRLATIDAKRQSFGDTVRGEIETAKTWPGTIDMGAEDGQTDRTFTVTDTDRAAYIEWLGKWAAVGDGQYGDRPAMPAFPDIHDPFMVWMNENPQMMQRAWDRDTVDQVQNLLLDTGLALQAFKMDNGHYPGSLSALVPKYLPTAPTDPFAAAATLQFHRDRDSYVLYSVGPDGIDDHGNTIAKGSGGPDAKGDIVANVNSW